jgi:hypothetical protein
MKRFSARQIGFAAMIVATAFFTWTYTANSSIWQSAAFVYEALASTGPAVSTSINISPATDATGNRPAPVTVTLTVHDNWGGGMPAPTMRYRVLDLTAASAVIYEGQTNSSVPLNLDVAAGQTHTFRVERSAFQQRTFLETEGTSTVDVVVYRLPPEPAGPAVTTSISVAPAVDATGKRVSPAVVTLRVTSNWDPAFVKSMTYRAVDASTGAVIASGTSSSETTFALTARLAETKTYNVERSATVATTWGTRTEATSTVAVVVYTPEPAGPAVSTTMSVTPAADSTGKHLSPALVTLGVTSNWDPAYSKLMRYRVVDTADESIVAEGTSSDIATVALSASPGVTKTYRVERSAAVATFGGNRYEPTSTVEVKVYRAKLTTVLGRPSTPSKSKSTVKTKITGTISPERSIGATTTVKVKLYRWEKPKGKKKSAWVYKKSVWATLDTATTYTASSKLSKGTWSAIATSVEETAYKAATSPRSRSIAVK